MSEMSAGDYALMANANGGNGGWNNMWNNPFMYLVWLALFRGNGCGGGLFGNGGCGDNGNAEAQVLGAINSQGMQTRQDITNGFNFQDNMNQLRENYAGIRTNQDTIRDANWNLANKMCEETSDLERTIFAGDTNIKDAINCNSANLKDSINWNGKNISEQLCCGFNSLGKEISEASYRQQLANCGIERNIDNLKFDNERNTCKITNAIHGEGEATRALITSNEVTRLRTDLQSAQIALSNSQQTQNILNSLGRFVAYAGCGSNCPSCSGSNNQVTYALPYPAGYPNGFVPGQGQPNYVW